MRTTVIGAGVIGLSCAFELVERGHTVTIVDSGRAGAGSSAGNAGWVTPVLATPRANPSVIVDAARSVFSADGPARVRPHAEIGFARWTAGFLRASTARRNAAATAALQRLCTQVMPAYDALADRGVEFEMHTDGLAVVFKQHQNLEHFGHTVTRMRQYGYTGSAVVRYEGRDIRDFEPALADGVAGVLHVVSERHVRPETLTAALAQAVSERGGEIIEGDRVERLRQNGSGAWSVLTRSGREIVSDHLVVAAGYAAGALVQRIGVRLPLEAAKGTSLTAVGRGTIPKHPMKLYENMVACSPFGNTVRLSGTFDLGARDNHVDSGRLDMVVRHGLSYLRDWAPEQIEMSWVGHRPTTADDLPAIGPIPGRRGLYIATGHGTLGVTLGPLTGRLVADEICAGLTHAELAPLRPTRFR